MESIGMNFDDIINQLYIEGFIVKNNGTYFWKNRNCKLSDSLQKYADLYADNRTFLYCILNKIRPEDIPTCPICNEKVKLTSSGVRFFQKTCGKKECQNKLRELKSLEKYGVKNISLAPEVQKKKEKKAFEKWGVKSPLMAEEVKEKIKESLINHYGNNYSKVIIKKSNETIYEKYGVDNASKIPEVKSKKTLRYLYDGYYFRSSYELVFYIYHKDKGDNISYESVKIPYKDAENNLHIYTPDFCLNDKLIEIKGEIFLDDDGNLDSSFYNGEKTEKDIYKQKCMEENNVILITDISKEYQYVINNYSVSMIKSCKCKV